MDLVLKHIRARRLLIDFSRPPILEFNLGGRYVGLGMRGFIPLLRW
ncbi:hypothetical protein COLO4_17044 [Corchorus olitorius]|uniref:Uncharacterized protein n=1 Tax=Corchorus olitorius TaxID=93759 RepID=A0A1R3JEE6_9ROSI|nr:hypothetical protein COLO4_17044 [Corchorus olitorius]